MSDTTEIQYLPLLANPRPVDVIPIVDMLTGTTCQTPLSNVAVVKQTYVQVSSAQILDSLAVPIPILAAPGAGKILIPVMAGVSYVPGSIAYTVSPARQFRFIVGGTTVMAFTQDNFMDGLAARYINPISTGMAGVTANITNQGMVMQSAGSPPTLGNGTLDIYVWYFLATP